MPTKKAPVRPETLGYAPWMPGGDSRFAHLHMRDPPELGDFRGACAQGRPVGDTFPDDVVFNLSPDHGVFLPDSIPNASNLYVVSEKLRAILEKTTANIEFYRVRIRNHKKRIEKAPYFIANLLDIVDCMDKKRSEYRVDEMDPTQAARITRLVLDEKKIPEDAQIFRLRSERRRFIVRDDLGIEIYRNQECTGVLFIRVEDYGSEFREVVDDYGDEDEDEDENEDE